jgi:transcriptional regulator GlxA family with amidase domain
MNPSSGIHGIGGGRPIGSHQVAMNCGFSTMSRFYDAFKNITGDAPGRMRSSPRETGTAMF